MMGLIEIKYFYRLKKILLKSHLHKDCLSILALNGMKVMNFINKGSLHETMEEAGTEAMTSKS